MADNFEKFTIIQTAMLIRNNRCLIIDFADKAGKWGLPGGRIDKGEMGQDSLARELKEEINLNNFQFIATIAYDTWYEADIPYCGTVNLIKNDADEITLSIENRQYKWVSEQDLEKYTFVWPSFKDMIKKGFAYQRLLEK